jgi:hypothetical protein
MRIAFCVFLKITRTLYPFVGLKSHAGAVGAKVLSRYGSGSIKIVRNITISCRCVKISVTI